MLSGCQCCDCWRGCWCWWVVLSLVVGVRGWVVVTMAILVSMVLVLVVGGCIGGDGTGLFLVFFFITEYILFS